ncbi:MAG: hypothetical protein JWN14_4471 [Chthonomonadales bacterium]|nr:hypothetical protein [Chthonomonadales bacterium]
MAATDFRITRKKAGIRRLETLAEALDWNKETVSDIEGGKVGVDDATRSTILTTIERLRIRPASAPQRPTQPE